MFDLRLQPPKNFASYRQAELDNKQESVHLVKCNKYLSLVIDLQ
jgi:hypothetical protein